MSLPSAEALRLSPLFASALIVSASETPSASNVILSGVKTTLLNVSIYAVISYPTCYSIYLNTT